MAKSADLKRGLAKFCSLSCFGRYKTENTKPKPSNTECRYCGKKFYKSPSRLVLSKSGLHFCSRTCKDEGQTLAAGIKEIWPPHFGQANGFSNYRIRAFSEYDPVCNRCGYDEEPGILMVHHRDRNTKNNTVNNLEILCPNCHMLDHFKFKDGLYTPFPSRFRGRGAATVASSLAMKHQRGG